MQAVKGGNVKGVMPSVGREMLDKTPKDKKSLFARFYSKSKDKK